MKTPVILWAAGLAAMLAVSCAPATPEARIERNPAAFEALPAKQQEDVRAGRIARGMSPDAVLLAWGRPAMRVEVMRGQGPSERWDYTGSQPMFVNNHFGHHSWGRRGWGPGFGPDVVHIPYRRASVWFLNGRVESWERVQ